LVKTPKTPG